LQKAMDDGSKIYVETGHEVCRITFKYTLRVHD